MPGFESSSTSLTDHLTPQFYSSSPTLRRSSADKVLEGRSSDQKTGFENSSTSLTDHLTPQFYSSSPTLRRSSADKVLEGRGRLLKRYDYVFFNDFHYINSR